MATNGYISLKEYLESQPDAVLLFVLTNARGEEVTRQIVKPEDLGLTATTSYTAKFVVDELLSAKMIPATYTLYLYIGLPKPDLHTATLSPQDYAFDRCLTDQGVKLRVRGGALGPSVGVHDNG